MEAPSEKLVEKLKKLLILANDRGATEAEASSAMAKVQELLAIYNLSMADLESHGAAPTEDGRREKFQRTSAMYEYQRRLMEAIAQAHYCLYMSFKGPGIGNDGKPRNVWHHRLIGRQGNVMAANMMFDYLNQTINYLGRCEYPGGNNQSRSAMSWKDGCATRLCERLVERRRAMDAEQAKKVQEERARAKHPGAAPSMGTALVLLSDIRGTEEDLNNDFRYGYEPGTTARRRREWEAGEAQRDAEIMKRHQLAVETEAKRRAALTPEQRAREDRLRAEQDAKDARANERYWRSQDRKEYAKHARRDHSAFAAGRAKGETVGLDPQLAAQEKRRIS